MTDQYTGSPYQERLMGRGKNYRPVTTTDRLGKKSTEWEYVGSGTYGKLNRKFPMKDEYGKQMARKYLKETRGAHGLDLKTGLKPERAKAIRRARAARLADNQTRLTFPPALAAK